MKVLFTKMHGLGNDYIFIDRIKNKYPLLLDENLPKVARFLSKEHFGVGSDGIILIDSSNKADFKMRVFNKDGSEAQMCGNGIRCFAKYIYDNKMTVKDKISIETLAGIKEVELVKNKDKNNVAEEYRVNMGVPKSEGTIRLNILNQPFIINKVSMGNPHAVIFVRDVDKVNVQRYGPLIETNYNFPNKTNVEFVQILDKNLIKVRVWERGSKETYACGTGSCAAVVAGYNRNLTNRKVKVLLRGGELYITLDEKSNCVYMQGIATKVFDGIIDL